MPETAEEKEKKQKEQLEALSQIPEKIKIGDKEFALNPLPIGKIKVLGDVIFGIFSKVDAFGKIESKDPEDFKRLLIEKWSECIEEVITGTQVILSPNGKVALDQLMKDEEQKEFLRWNFTTEHLHIITGFILNSLNLKGLLKNVAPLRGM